MNRFFNICHNLMYPYSGQRGIIRTGIWKSWKCDPCESCRSVKNKNVNLISSMKGVLFFLSSVKGCKANQSRFTGKYVKILVPHWLTILQLMRLLCQMLVRSQSVWVFFFFNWWRDWSTNLLPFWTRCVNVYMSSMLHDMSMTYS